MKGMSRRTRHRRPRPAPQALDTHSPVAGLRAVAILEAAKGLLVILLEFGLLSLIHHDAAEVAENIVHHLHLNPEHHFGHAIIHAASTLTDRRLWAIAAGGLAYAAVRFVEAYGLWNRRVWAEWFALLSGALYLPWEIYEFGEKATPIRGGILLTNLIIVSYMLFIRIRESKPITEASA
jgi:uncharacterized membrane protein (DUF2068 family)